MHDAILCRIFGADQMTKIMGSFRLGDDIPIENQQVKCLMNPVVSCD